MIDNRTYAICAALFFSVLAWGLITFGGNEVKFFAFLSLMFGGMSQYAAQERSRFAYLAALFFAYAGMATMFVSVLWFYATMSTL